MANPYDFKAASDVAAYLPNVPVAWSSATAYKVGSLVVRANALFACNAAHTNQDPLTDCATVLAGSFWTFHSLRGGVLNYVPTAEQITSTSLALAPTPDEVKVFCPTGQVLLTFNAEYKISGTSLANSSAQMQFDDSAAMTPVVNAGATSATGTLSNTATFWSVIVGIASAPQGGLQPTPSTTADAATPTLPIEWGSSFAVFVGGVGVHKVNVKYAAGNGTTVVNVRERRLFVQGA